MKLEEAARQILILKESTNAPGVKNALDEAIKALEFKQRFLEGADRALKKW